MSEYNTKITYYTEGRLNLKKTARAHSKFYLAFYGRIALEQFKRRVNNEELSGTTN